MLASSLSASIHHIKVDKTLDEIPVILIVRVGKAGKTQIVDLKKFAVTENVLFLYPKKEFIGDFNLRWVENRLKGELERNACGEISGQRNISAEIISRIKFDVPNKNIQDQIAELTSIAAKVKCVLVRIIEELHKIQQRIVFEELDVKSFDENPIESIFHIEGGNSGLTEELIYYNLPCNEAEKVEIFTGATLKENKMGTISRLAQPNGRRLKIFQGAAILVVRKGLAGKMFYVDKEEFTTNDDVYALIPKNIWRSKINLKWFIHEYQNLFYNFVTSKIDNATFSKEYANRQTVKIPNIHFQNIFARKIDSFKSILATQNDIEKDIDDLLAYTIV